MLISKYRGELLGVATLMIVITHSIAIINFPPMIEKILGLLTTGVNVFLFLSGIGLYYSLYLFLKKSIIFFVNILKIRPKIAIPIYITISFIKIFLKIFSLPLISKYFTA